MFMTISSETEETNNTAQIKKFSFDEFFSMTLEYHDQL